MPSTAHEQAEWEGWQLETSSAEAYERYLVPTWSRPWAERLIELAAPEPGDRVLDVACGTGIVARLAAARVGEQGSVVGLDLNEDMLDVARAAARDSRPPVEWRQGDATELPLPDATFDLVLCQQGLQFFVDREVALREMRRVLGPGGRLGLSYLRPISHNPGWEALTDALARHAFPDAGEMLRSPFPEGDSAELRELVTSAGFRDVQIRIVVVGVRYPSANDLVRWEAAASPLAGPLAALDAVVREAMIRELGEALRPYTDDDGIVFPSETYVATARR